MLVMQVRCVVVLVFDAVVPVPMRVLAGDNGIVDVEVVTVVVAMRVLVLEPLVNMTMRMMLGEMKKDSDPESDRGERGSGTGRAIPERPPERRTDEGPSGEHGTRTARTDAPLGKQVEPQAESIASSAAEKQPKRFERAWCGLPD
jgi:hypothetical protein